MQQDLNSIYPDQNKMLGADPANGIGSGLFMYGQKGGSDAADPAGGVGRSRTRRATCRVSGQHVSSADAGWRGHPERQPLAVRWRDGDERALKQQQAAQSRGAFRPVPRAG